MLNECTANLPIGRLLVSCLRAWFLFCQAINQNLKWIQTLGKFGEVCFGNFHSNFAIETRLRSPCHLAGGTRLVEKLLVDMVFLNFSKRSLVLNVGTWKPHASGHKLIPMCLSTLQQLCSLVAVAHNAV